MVIVGAGVAGAITAKMLVESGQSVLLIEAGRATSIRPEGYASFVEYYHKALVKTPNSPYPMNANAPSSEGYQIFKGPQPFQSTYTRVLGGTTLHFLGTCMRMLPNDFRMQSMYGRGIDWPISYASMNDFYEQAELEIGVSADVNVQGTLGLVPFRKGYEYPMQQIPQSYLDLWLTKHLQGLTHDMAGEELSVNVVSVPAGRNGMPNPNYMDPRTKTKQHPKGLPYQPKGAPYDSRLGQRCEGNSSCVPICPVMAKYNALRTLYSVSKAAQQNLTVMTQTVASQIELNENRSQVTGIVCRQYDFETGGNAPGKPCRAIRVRGRAYVIAAHAIETAKLLLASNAANSSDQVGRNLMDHPYFLTWGLAPEGTRLGVFRGPLLTSELPMRDGKFRSQFAAFRGDIRNTGWDFNSGAPYSNLAKSLERNLFGKALRGKLYDDVQRQISFGFQIEQLPNPENRVTIDEQYVDPIGNPRPVLTFDIDEYSQQGILEAKRFSDAVLQKVGAVDKTEPNVDAPGNVKIGRKKYTVFGSGHIVGTHRMGADAATSVVNAEQQTWDHDNLYLVGCGNMPTLGTSNPTLTVAALACRLAETLKKKVQ